MKKKSTNRSRVRRDAAVVRGNKALELANLSAAIAGTRDLIARHEEALRNLDTKLLNQLAEFHRQSLVARESRPLPLRKGN